MPLVSVLMPTYNRIDTIGRAIASVQAQTFSDWELVVVDDGSTDGTRDHVAKLDPRIRIIVQENQGIGGARNTALAHAKGDLVSFLDSDDAWPPHHLALATAFFAAFPGEHLYTSEFWEDFGSHDYVKHFRVETGHWYPATARRIRSTAFEGPPPQGDPYLWFYERRTPIGDWAKPVLGGTPYADVFHYTGNIHRAWRWGWLMAMQSTVITRHAMERNGRHDPRYRIASDFGYMASLCKHFTTNLVSAPGCIKNELSDDGRPLSEEHLVTGRTAVEFHQDCLRYLEDLFWNEAPDDPELSALRGFRQYLVGRTALLRGERDVALAYLRPAAKAYPGRDVDALLWLARLVPSGALSSKVYRAALAADAMPRRARRMAVRVARSGLAGLLEQVPRRASGGARNGG